MSIAKDTIEAVHIVDDDDAILAGLSDLLESAGLRTRQYLSAEKFLESWNPRFAGCLVLDVRLPGMSGIELQGYLAQNGVAFPVIIMTAHGDMPMVRKALKAGAVSLSERERQIMNLVTAGLTNKEIADKVFLSVVTVKLHRSQVMRKMQAASLADLVKMSEWLKNARGSAVS